MYPARRTTASGRITIGRARRMRRLVGNTTSRSPATSTPLTVLATLKSSQSMTHTAVSPTT